MNNQQLNPIEKAKKDLVTAIDIAIQKGCFNIHECKEIIIALETIIGQPNIEFGGINAVEKEEEIND